METGETDYQMEIPTWWLRCWAWAKDLLSTHHSLPMQLVLVGLGPFVEWCIVMLAIKWERRVWQMLVHMRCWDSIHPVWGCSRLWIKHGIRIRKGRKLHNSLKTVWDSLPKVRNPVPAMMLERIPLGLPEVPCYICWLCAAASTALNVYA